jgi:hypothetical protein
MPLYPTVPTAGQQQGLYGYPLAPGAAPTMPATRKSNSAGWVIAVLFIILGLILLGVLIANSPH